jgi:hypothetical protein
VDSALPQNPSSMPSKQLSRTVPWSFRVPKNQ